MNKRQVRFYADQIRSEVRSGGEVMKAIEVMVNAAEAEPEPLVVNETVAERRRLFQTPSGSTSVFTAVATFGVPGERQAMPVTVMVFERAVPPMQKEEQVCRGA